MKIDNENINSKDLSVLGKSLGIINEHLERENLRGESANKRANVLVTFIGFGATIVLALASEYLSKDYSLNILIYILFASINVYLFKSTYYILNIISTRQVKRLSPDMINEIQDCNNREAIAYEIKWKIWEYNQIVPENSRKLWFLSRAQRNIIFAIISILTMGFLVFIDDRVVVSANWIAVLQIVIGCLVVVFSFLVDQIFERYSFWKLDN